MVPGKHWLTAETPKLAKPLSQLKSTDVSMAIMILKETQYCQEKSPTSFYKGKVTRMTAEEYGASFVGWGIEMV